MRTATLLLILATLGTWVSGSLVASAAERPSSAKASEGKPNVILIFIDDMGFGDVEFNGGTLAKTPHLNQMAKEGRRFHDFYVGCAVCSGSRTALLTGCHYQRLSMNAVLFPNSKNGLHPDEVTLADMLKEAGYKTTCIGKYRAAPKVLDLATFDQLSQALGQLGHHAILVAAQGLHVHREPLEAQSPLVGMAGRLRQMGRMQQGL